MSTWPILSMPFPYLSGGCIRPSQPRPAARPGTARPPQRRWES